MLRYIFVKNTSSKPVVNHISWIQSVTRRLRYPVTQFIELREMFLKIKIALLFNGFSF